MANKEDLTHKSQEASPENVEDTKIKSNEGGSKVKAFPERENKGTDENVLNSVGEDVGDVEGDVADNDPRVEARDVVHTDKTAEMADRVHGVEKARRGASKRELLESVPAAPAAPQPLNMVAYEEYTAEVAAQNAEAARAALKLTPEERAQRVQELQRVAAAAYEGK